MVRRHPTTHEDHLSVMRWGLRPYGTASDHAGFATVPAETIAADDSLARLLSDHRCLVPVDSFVIVDEPAMAGQRRVSRHDGITMALGGLWSCRRSTSNEVTYGFAIVTIVAGGTEAGTGGRLPLVLKPEHWSAWLDADGVEACRLMLDHACRLATQRSGAFQIDCVGG
jgi:putative SOS response-associated peptidase YedK